MDSLIEHITLNYGSIDLSFFCVSLKREDERTPILHRHDYYEIHFGGSGKYEYQFGDKTVSLPPNHIIVIPPDVLHYSVDLLKKPTPTVVSFSMDTSCQDKKLYTSLVSALSDISLKPISFNNVSADELLLLHKPQLYGSFLGVCRLKSIASDFIYKLFSIALKGKDFTVSDDKKALLLIDNLINLPNISIKDIAAATNYSERQVSRLIKSHYGLTLSQIKQQSKGRK